jgi:hypothetical protein
LFHDHQYVEAGDIHHIHIPYNDKRQLDLHKKRINEMLEINGKYWLDIITYSRGTLYCSINDLVPIVL